MPARQFFLTSSVDQLSRSVVNVGGQGDCGFRAIAAGLIDNFNVFPRLNKPLLQKVLQSHLSYYPQHRPLIQSLEDPRQLMAQVLRRIDMSELIPSMAYTLRQLAVDEMVKNPAQYPGAFVQNNEHTSPAEMRCSRTWIDESSISALAYALDLPIDVRVIIKGKELAASPLKYNANVKSSITNPTVVIELERQHYRPCLVKPEAFKSNVYDSKPPLSPVQMNIVDRDMQEILQEIAEVEKHMLETFERTRDRLITMVEAGELTKKNLLDLYIKGISTSDYLQGRVKHVDQEYHADFFSRAIAQLPNHSSSQSCDDAIVAELVHALSRAISIGDMRAEDVFTQVDAQQYTWSGM